MNELMEQQKIKIIDTLKKQTKELRYMSQCRNQVREIGTKRAHGSPYSHKQDKVQSAMRLEISTQEYMLGLETVSKKLKIVWIK